MTYDEFKNNLGKAGVTAHKFAKLIKMNPSSISNYSQSGVVPSHLAVIAALLGEMKENKVDFERILGMIEIKRKKSRGKVFDVRFGVGKQGASQSKRNDGENIQGH